MKVSAPPSVALRTFVNQVVECYKKELFGTPPKRSPSGELLVPGQRPDMDRISRLYNT